MQDPDGFWVTQAESSIFTRKLFGKLIELFQISFNFDRGVQQDGKNGLSGASVVDYLACEEQFWVVINEGVPFFDISGPLEEEDEAVDMRLYFCDELIILHAVDLFDLDGRSSDFLD